MEINTEKQLQESNRLLKELMSRLSPVDPEEDIQKQEEIDEVNKSIEEYEVEINKLKEKLENPDNYKRIASIFEGDNTNLLEEMTKDSVDKERASIINLMKEYRKGQEVETKKIKGYNSEVVRLKEEIDNIHQRLSKDEIAKKSNIAKNIHLTIQEIHSLREEINYRESLIEEANRIIDLCGEEIRRYGRLITENSEHLEILKQREELVTGLKKDRILLPKNSVDVYALSIDKDNLSKLESGLKALKNRLQTLMYNPSEEIKKQIEENEKALNSLKEEEKPKSKFNFVENKEKLEENIINKELNETINKLFSNTNIEDNDVQVDPSVASEKLTPKEDLNRIINNVFAQPVAPKLEEKEETKVEHELEQPDEKTMKDIRSELEILELYEIDDAPEYLKKEKLTTKFINAWQNWKKKLSAASIELVYDVAGRKSMNEIYTEQNEEGDWGYKKLSNEGEYTSVNLPDGGQIYIRYGDRQEDVPEDITIKYINEEMHIYYPRVKVKHM